MCCGSESIPMRARAGSRAPRRSATTRAGKPRCVRAWISRAGSRSPPRCGMSANGPIRSSRPIPKPTCGSRGARRRASRCRCPDRICSTPGTSNMPAASAYRVRYWRVFDGHPEGLVRSPQRADLVLGAGRQRRHRGRDRGQGALPRQVRALRRLAAIVVRQRIGADQPVHRRARPGRFGDRSGGEGRSSRPASDRGPPDRVYRPQLTVPYRVRRRRRGGQGAAGDRRCANPECDRRRRNAAARADAVRFTWRAYRIPDRRCPRTARGARHQLAIAGDRSVAHLAARTVSVEVPSARTPLGPRVALGLALMLLVLGVGVILFSDHQYRLDQQQQIETQARVVASGIVAPLDFDDVASAQDYLSALSADPRVADATVRDRAGRSFVTYRRPKTGMLTTTAAATVPVLRGLERLGSVTLVEPLDPLWRRLTRYSVLILLTVMAGLLVMVFAIGQAALHRANAALSQRARALGEANDALEREMEDRARAEEQLRQAQKMQALGQLTGGIAHDFNNLLTVVRGTADLLRQPGLAEARRMRYAESIAQVAERAAQLTSQLLAFSRRQPLHPEVVDLNARLQGMLLMFERLLGAQYSVDTSFDPGICPVEVDPTQLEVAILNIVVNARDAMVDGGKLTVTTGPWPPEAGDGDHNFSALSVSDDGTGMDAETLARAMEPFFTTKIVGKGTGLGLSQVYGFATQSGGEVIIDSEVGRGATVRLILPCTTNELMVEIVSEIVPAAGWG